MNYTEAIAEIRSQIRPKSPPPEQFAPLARSRSSSETCQGAENETSLKSQIETLKQQNLEYRERLQELSRENETLQKKTEGLISIINMTAEYCQQSLLRKTGKELP